MTAADYEALEARVTELEHQMRNVLPAKIDAVSYGVSLLHEDLRAFRGEMGERLGAIEISLDRHGERLGAIDTRLDRHGEMLGEILRRLPAEPA
jgi:hypothetical protein